MSQASYIRLRNEGFTLLEVLLAVAIIAILTGFSVPVYQSFQVKNDLDIAASNAAHSLRRAQLLAQATDGDSPWGVKVRPGSIVLFKGAAFDSREVSQDEVMDLPAALTPSGETEFVFSKLTGIPATDGTLTISSVNGGVKNITVNPRGIVSY